MISADCPPEFENIAAAEPTPEFSIFKTAPDALPKDWVRRRIFEVSAKQLVQLEDRVAKSPVTLALPPLPLYSTLRETSM